MQVDLDTEYIRKQIQDVLEIADWDTVQALYISGSFANQSKPVTDSSDIDVELVLKSTEEFYEAQGEIPCYDGMNPATIHVTADDGNKDYGNRTMDLITSGEVPSDIDLIKLL